jgi:UDP:flavonoid glycosyltransferase YjiC (YdhE family)
MTLLLVSPDYASHALPLLTIAGAWQRRGQRVVVATGPTMAPLVRAAGMEHAELIMSRGSNPGLIRNQRVPDDEARSLERFFAATRQGMVETLRYQAEARSVDLLWRPRQVALRIQRLVELHRPDTILVDHLAFGASIGLRAMGAKYGDVVLGHPTALPVGDEIYGVPSAWPPVLNPDLVELESLRATARGVTEAFTYAYNDALHSIEPDRAPVADAFAAHGDIVLYNYPADLHGPIRTAKLPRHAFLGSAVRSEPADPEISAWLAQDPEQPLVVVSLGTFLSAREDVLTRIASALRRLDVRVALAIGPNDPEHFGALPASWLVRPSLPQVSLLEHASLLITHAGNNSVTEALTFGVPMLALPFSTDQFDGAASIERSLAGIALDPNESSRPLLAGSVRGLLQTPPSTPGLLGERLRRQPGSELAYAAMASLDDPPDEHDRHAARIVPAPLRLATC